MAGAPQAAQAGPWPQEEGHGQVILQLAPYTDGVRGVDDRGRPSGTGRLYRLDVGPYWEHGLSPRWTIGLAPRLSASWLDERTRTTSSYGVAEVAGFLRYQVYKGDYDTFSVQVGASTPGFARDSRNLRLAEPQTSYSIGASYGVGVPLPRGISLFASIEANYRYRPGINADDVNIYGTIGLRPIPRWLVLAQSFSTIGIRNNAPDGADYAVNKVQFTVAHELTERHTIAIGYLRDLDGRRVSLGQGVFGSLWYKY